jgi:hypothetical protein
VKLRRNLLSICAEALGHDLLLLRLKARRLLSEAARLRKTLGRRRTKLAFDRSGSPLLVEKKAIASYQLFHDAVLERLQQELKALRDHTTDNGESLQDSIVKRDQTYGITGKALDVLAVGRASETLFMCERDKWDWYAGVGSGCIFSPDVIECASHISESLIVLHSHVRETCLQVAAEVSILQAKHSFQTCKVRLLEILAKLETKSEELLTLTPDDPPAQTTETQRLELLREFGVLQKALSLRMHRSGEQEQSPFTHDLLIECESKLSFSRSNVIRSFEDHAARLDLIVQEANRFLTGLDVLDRESTPGAQLWIDTLLSILHYRDKLLSLGEAIGNSVELWQKLLNTDEELSLRDRNNINTLLDGLDSLTIRVKNNLATYKREEIKQVLADAIASERQLLSEVKSILDPELQQAELWSFRVELAERRGDENLAKRARRRLNAHKDLINNWASITAWGNSLEVPESWSKLRSTIERIESSCGLQVNASLNQNNTLLVISLLDRAIFLAENLTALSECTEAPCAS